MAASTLPSYTMICLTFTRCFQSCDILTSRCQARLKRPSSTSPPSFAI